MPVSDSNRPNILLILALQNRIYCFCRICGPPLHLRVTRPDRLAAEREPTMILYIGPLLLAAVLSLIVMLYVRRGWRSRAGACSSSSYTRSQLRHRRDSGSRIRTLARGVSHLTLVRQQSGTPVRRPASAQSASRAIDTTPTATWLSAYFQGPPNPGLSWCSRCFWWSCAPGCQQRAPLCSLQSKINEFRSTEWV